MYRAGDVPEAGAVQIEIRARRRTPPSGVVVVDGGPERRFNGWLRLLSVLAEAFDPQPPPASAGSLGGELAPGGDTDFGERV
jgi:hypothetical protein